MHQHKSAPAPARLQHRSGQFNCGRCQGTSPPVEFHLQLIIYKCRHLDEARGDEDNVMAKILGHERSEEGEVHRVSLSTRIPQRPQLGRHDLCQRCAIFVQVAELRRRKRPAALPDTLVAVATGVHVMFTPLVCLAWIVADEIYRAHELRTTSPPPSGKVAAYLARLGQPRPVKSMNANCTWGWPKLRDLAQHVD